MFWSHLWLCVGILPFTQTLGLSQFCLIFQMPNAFCKLVLQATTRLLISSKVFQRTIFACNSAISCSTRWDLIWDNFYQACRLSHIAGEGWGNQEKVPFLIKDSSHLVCRLLSCFFSWKKWKMMTFGAFLFTCLLSVKQVATSTLSFTYCQVTFLEVTLS